MEIRIYTDREGHAPYEYWLEALPDRMARAKIRARLARVEAGNIGDCKPLRDGVQELRIDHGPGYRVYYTFKGKTLVLLLCGGDKSTQRKDIHLATEIAAGWEQ